MNAETDFVARNETFQQFVQDVAHAALSPQGFIKRGAKRDQMFKNSHVGLAFTA